MKTKILLIFSILIFISCSRTDKDILNEVSVNLNNLKTIKYLSEEEWKENGQIVVSNFDTISFDFTNGLKYHFNSKDGELIYNGKKVFQSDNNEKNIITDESNSLEIINNLLYLTPYSLKEILPKLIQDKDVKISKLNDSLINQKKYFVFKFLLEKRFIDWVNLEFKEGIDFDNEYIFLIDKRNYLPYKVISQNGKNGTISRTIENLETNIKFNDKLWSGENLPVNYTSMTFNDYVEGLHNKSFNNVGKKLINWELTELSTDKIINSSNLNGNVVLLEFWFRNCGGCLAAIPSLNNIKSQFENKNFKIYAIDFRNDEKSKLEKYIQEKNIQFPILYNGKNVAKKLEVYRAPTFMVIDKKGNIIDVKIGYSENNMKEIIETIETNL